MDSESWKKNSKKKSDEKSLGNHLKQSSVESTKDFNRNKQVSCALNNNMEALFINETKPSI